MEKRIVLLLLLVSFMSAVSGQHEIRRPYVINYDKQAYGGGNQNWSVSSTRKGLTYIGNNEGLLEFDGTNWHLHTMQENLIIRAVLADDSSIYAGGYEEFGFWKRGKSGSMTYHSLSDSLDSDVLHNEEIWRIRKLHGKIYYQSFTSVYVYNGHSITRLNPQNVIVLLLQARGRLFVHQIDRGLFQIGEDTLQDLGGETLLHDDEVKFMLPHKTDRYILGAARKGLILWDGENFKTWDIPAAERIRRAEVNAAVKLDSLYAIGTIVDGIYILNASGKLKYHLSTDNLLQNNTVLSMDKDHQGNFWAALDRGVDYVDMHTVMDIYMDPSRKVGSVYAGALSGNTLWIGSNRGLFAYDFSPITGFSVSHMVPGSSGQVWDLQKFGNQLLCGHTKGTFEVSENALQKISDNNGGYDFETIRRDKETYLLQSSYSFLGLYKKSGGRWRYSHDLDGFIEPVPKIVQDHLGNIWAAHLKKGIFRIRMDASLDSVELSVRYGKESGFPTSRKLMVENVEERIVFTTGEALYTYDDLRDTIIPYDYLNNNVGIFKQAENIVAAGDHLYWFIFSNRIALFRIEAGTVKQTFSYDLARQGMHMLSNHPGIVPLNDDLHLVCLDNGFALYNANRMETPADSVDVRIHRVIAQNKKGEKLYFNPDAGKIRIPYAYRNLHIEFATLRKMVQPLYRYRLKGLQDAYSDWQGKGAVYFTRLPYGEFSFQVQALGLGSKASETAGFQVIIEPPVYASRLAFMLYAILLVAAALLLRFYIKRRLRRQARKVEQQERVKREKEQMEARQRYMKLKNEKLQSEISHKSIQLANYTMNVINKNDLLIRIKQEIQKQKKDLGPRYPNYYYRRLMDMLNRNISSADEWKAFEAQFDQAHENFFKRLKEAYPDLTQSDLKLSALLRMNLSSKEIAPLLNISIRGVEARRYRLRKRLNLEHDENLVEFLLQF